MAVTNRKNSVLKIELKDGTINASERNPKPLREFLPHRSSVTGNNNSSGAASSAAEHRVSSIGMPALPGKGRRLYSIMYF